MQELIKSFNEISEKYDSQRRKLIPCFDDFYGTAVQFADVNTSSPKILDIGAGTGLFSNFLAAKYPDSEITLIDISEDMLQVAMQRFNGKDNFKYICSDYSEYDFSEKFDIVASSLSIHHLEDVEKKKLFRTIHGILNRGGVFINADQHIAENVEIEKKSREVWYEFIGQSGLTEAEIEAAHKRMLLDKLSTTDSYLKWMKEAGFTTAELVYKYLVFGVIFSRKENKE